MENTPQTVLNASRRLIWTHSKKVDILQQHEHPVGCKEGYYSIITAHADKLTE